MSHRIPDEPKSIDVLSFSDFMKRVPISEFDRDKVPPAVKVPGRVSSWHDRRSIGDPDIQSFHLRGEYTKIRYNFLTRCDWKGLFVPLVLVAPTDPAHERFNQYHEYKKPDELAGEAEIKEAARVLVNSYERSEAARLSVDGEPFHLFRVNNYANRAIPFLCRPGWKGLWVHEIIAEDGLEVEPQNRSYRKYKSVDEAIGESEVRAAARKYVQDFDGVRTAKPRKGTQKAKPYFAKLGPKRQLILADIKNYLSCALKMPVSDSETLRWALDQSWIHLLPDDFKSPTLDQEALWGEGRKRAMQARPETEKTEDQS